MAAILAMIVVTAALSLVVLHSRGASASNEGVKECPDLKQVVPVDITTPGSTVKVQCANSVTMAPVISGNSKDQVFCDESCSSPKPLNELCPGATGSMSNKVATLTFPQLPNNTTTFYLQCKGNSNTCLFSVTVQKPPPQGPQTCAVKGTTVELAVQGQHGSVKFGCGGNMKLKPTDPKKVYKSDCKSEENLKDMTLSTVDKTFFLLTPTKSPHSKTICYLCGEQASKGRGTEDDCKVLINVSSGRRATALSAFGLAIPFVLTLLHFA